MRTTMIRWTLISGLGLTSLALSACSGAGGDPSPADVPQGAATAPLASASAPPPDGRHGHRDPAEMVKRFDKNGDGKLQISELPDHMQAWLGKADADHDGVLSVAELTAARDSFKKEWAEHRGGFRGKADPSELVKHFDKNSDGKLQVSELPDRMQAWLGKADADHDGVLSIAELTAARDSLIKEHFARMDKSGDGALTKDEVGERRWARLSAADADGSGSVTLAEMQQAVASGKLRFPGHHGHHDDKDHPSEAPAPVGS